MITVKEIIVWFLVIGAAFAIDMYIGQSVLLLVVLGAFPVWSWERIGR